MSPTNSTPIHPHNTTAGTTTTPIAPTPHLVPPHAPKHCVSHHILGKGLVSALQQLQRSKAPQEITMGVQGARRLQGMEQLWDVAGDPGLLPVGGGQLKGGKQDVEQRATPGVGGCGCVTCCMLPWFVC